MSANGHLKFQGTNRATFVGATSNIMFDTTSTSLGIGVTGTDHPSSNLYITGNGGNGGVKTGGGGGGAGGWGNDGNGNGGNGGKGIVVIRYIK